MFDHNKKPWLDDLMKPCETPFSPFEKAEDTVREMRNTIDRLLKFETWLKDTHDSLMKEITRDNVIFKETYAESYKAFLDQVKTEITQFESTLSNKWKLFETTVSADYQRFVETTFTEFETKYNEVKAYMKENLLESINTLFEGMNHDGTLATIINTVLTTDFENRLVKLESCKVETFGAKGDGVTDDTIAINTALQSASRIVFEDKTYLISDTLNVPSNATIEVKNAKITSTATENKKYIFNVSNAENVRIIGANATLEMLKPDTPQQACVSIANSKNIIVKGFTLKGAGGDGVIIGGSNSNISKDVAIVDCIIDGNRRNGISVIGGVDGVYIEGNTVKNTGGTSPELGIDLETWQPDLYNKNVVISRNRFEGNKNGDITVFEYSQNITISENDCSGTVNVKVNTDYNNNVTACPTKIFIHGNRFKKALYFYGVPYAQLTVTNNIFNGTNVTAESPFAVPAENRPLCPAKLIKGNTFNNCGTPFSFWYSDFIKICENIVNDCKGFVSLGNVNNSEIKNNMIIGYNVDGNANLLELNGACKNVEIASNIFIPSALSKTVPKIINVSGGSVTDSRIIDNDFSNVQYTAFGSYGNRNNNIDKNIVKGVKDYVSALPTAGANFAGMIVNVGTTENCFTYICLNDGGAWKWKELKYSEV